LKGEKKLISEGKSPRVSPSMSKTEALKIVQDHIETVEKRELEERTGPLAKSLLNVLKKQHRPTTSTRTEFHRESCKEILK
jgi:hypothetical protein